MIRFPLRRTSDIVFVDRVVLTDPNLSLAAKGLYAVVAAWEEGQSEPTDESLADLLEELTAAGYATVGEDGEVVVGWPGADREEELDTSPPIPRPRVATATHPGWAYAISNPEAKQVKIGFTQNVPQRLKALQTAHAFDLHVLWQGVGGEALEAHLHTRFARRRIRGEWFDFTGVDARKLIEKAAKSFLGGAR